MHLSCLRQWQKSVLLTQSTHPKYQTRIDEICASVAFPVASGFVCVSFRPAFAAVRLGLKLKKKKKSADTTEYS